MIEVEIYRQTALRSIGRTIVDVEIVDPFALRHGSEGTTVDDVTAALRGHSVVAARRIGKLLLLDLAAVSPTQSIAGQISGTLGLRFGMTGRLLVDDQAGINELLYTSDRNDAAWDRFRVRFDDGGSMALRDPRRLGAVSLEPDESSLGPDALSLSFDHLSMVLRGSKAPVKARIMDQGRISGIGNLLADEILWRAGISPQTVASSLSTAHTKRLYEAIGETLTELTARGGSHLGDVIDARSPGGRCPRPACRGAAMITAQVGGRTSWWCSKHQR
jgi:formamidopyrimidine-DNA glycosylase